MFQFPRALSKAHSSPQAPTGIPSTNVNMPLTWVKPPRG
jgi:hypothetical protein